MESQSGRNSKADHTHLAEELASTGLDRLGIVDRDELRFSLCAFALQSPKVDFEIHLKQLR